MNESNYTLLANLFSNGLNIKVLCAIYDGEVSLNHLSKLLELPTKELISVINYLKKNGFVIETNNNNEFQYRLLNPNLCNSIILLSDDLSKMFRISSKRFNFKY